MNVEEEQMETTLNVPAEDDFLAKGDVKDHFSEVEEVISLIKNLKNVYDNQISSELSDEKFTFTIDKYQEQPHLLDPHLEKLLTLLLEYVRDKASSPKLLHHVFKYMYLITKTRGHKMIVRLFPHEVADLEPILAMLHEQDPNLRETWEIKYMLLLWLSMICLIPFDMAKFDSDEKLPLMTRLIEVGKLYLLLNADNCQEAAAMLLSKIMIRPDAQEKQLPSFVSWTIERIVEANSKSFNSIANMKGCLMVLVSIFSLGSRNNLIPLAPTVLEQVNECNILSNKHSIIRKLGVKLVQRLGTTFLAPVVAKWRYLRGCRSLKDTLKTSIDENSEANVTEEDDTEYDIPEEMEITIEHLLTALHDSDTIVRWSAAKGIGRITSRLPREFADDVVGSVIDCFSDLQADGAWHGGCLTLAELGRRGLLLPNRLKDVVPMLLRALIYDIKRGACSVGTHVRDSACYLAWSFARAYTPEVIKPCVKDVAQTLLIVTAFDREVNCRRAASAAFQENVGRQGQFPHGISILTKADYFAVGSRNNAYLKVAPFIAKFSEYTTAFVDHLCEYKVDHWDPEIRWLAANALHKLTPINPTYMITNVLDRLLKMSTGIDLSARHGGLIALAEITHSLHEVEIKSSPGLLSSKTQMKTIMGLGRKFLDGKLFRGYGGELMRIACCHLIARISQCREIIKPIRIVTETWLEIVHDTLSNLHTFSEPEEVCNAAVKALAEINHITIASGGFAELHSKAEAGNDEVEKVLDQYLEKLESSVEKQRCGYAQAVAALPRPVLKGRFLKICNALSKASRITDAQDVTFAEARMHALRGIVKICKSAGIDKDGDLNNLLCLHNINAIYNILLDSLKDYTKDTRGDVGSMVRQAGVEGLHSLTMFITETDKELFNKDLIERLMCSLLQQACEKMHKVREAAKEAIYSIVYSKTNIPYIPHHKELCTALFDGKLNQSLKQYFRTLSKVMCHKVYLYHMLLGMVISVGDLTQSLAEASGRALCLHLKDICEDEDAMLKFLTCLLEVFENNLKNTRVTHPMLKTLCLILQKDFFTIVNCMLLDEKKKEGELALFPAKLFSLVKQEVARTKDAQRLIASISVYCGLLQFEIKDVQKKAISELLKMLCHPYPKIRRTSATQLYEAILTFEALVADENNLENVMMILSETEWDNPVDELRPFRNELCGYFGVPVLKSVKKAKE